MDRTLSQAAAPAAELARAFVSRAAALYDRLPQEPTVRPTDPDALARLEARSIPTQGRPLEEVWDELLRDVCPGMMLHQHPRSFACVPSSSSTLLSWLGDLLTAAYNPHASCRAHGPALFRIEEKVIRWLCDQVGYPAQAGGLFLSGGSLANLTALTAARDAKLPEDQRGNAVVYLSDQTHASVSKALHIIGFRKDQLRVLPTDTAFRLDLSALRAAAAEDACQGKRPFAVVASAGSTNTGSIDPLNAIADLCQRCGMWMHVDGAYGASALLSPTQRAALKGIERSDSLSWDAHKWMLQTYACSMVLVREQSNLLHSFVAHPEYLQDATDSPESVEFWDLGPELTRPARGLKLWLTLQTLGSQEMGHIIDHGCALAQTAERLLRTWPDWEIVTPAQLAILNFRYAPKGCTPAQIDAWNHTIARQITESGFATVYTTELRGQTVLRLCTINPRTTEEDICQTLERLAELAQKF